MKQLKGSETDEILGEHFSKFFTNEARQLDVPEQLLETAWKTGAATHDGWLLRKDGSRFWAHGTVLASYDDNGTLRGFDKVIRESSESTSAV